MKKLTAAAVFASFFSFLGIANANSVINLGPILLEVKLAEFGQPGCGGTCPNIQTSNMEASGSSTKDQLMIRLEVEPAGCNSEFVFKNELSQLAEIGSDGTFTYRFFDSMPRNGAGSTCPSVQPRSLYIYEDARMSPDRVKYRFAQTNGKYTVVSYKPIKDGGVKRITDIKIEKDQ